MKLGPSEALTSALVVLVYVRDLTEFPFTLALFWFTGWHPSSQRFSCLYSALLVSQFMSTNDNGTLMDLALPSSFRWVWLCGLLVVGAAFITMAVLHRTFPDLIIVFGVGLVWIILPLAILFTNLVRRYGLCQAMYNLNFGLSGRDLDDPLQGAPREPTPEDKKAFLAVAKSASALTLATTEGAEDLCPICLDEEDMGDALITLRCGHVFHEKCIDSVIDTAYEKMYAPNYLGLPTLPRDEVLSSLRCPLCRCQIADVQAAGVETDDEGDIEQANQSIHEITSQGDRPLMRVASVVSLSAGMRDSSPTVGTPTAAPISGVASNHPGIVQL